MELSLPEQTLLLKLEADPLWQDARSYLEDKIYEQPVGLSGDEYKIRLEIREEKKGYWDAIKKALEKEGFMEFLNSLGTRTWLLAQAQRSIEEDPGSSGSFYVTIASALEPLLHHVLPSGLIEKAEQLGKEYNPQVLDHDVDTEMSEAKRFISYTLTTDVLTEQLEGKNNPQLLDDKENVEMSEAKRFISYTLTTVVLINYSCMLDGRA